MTKDELIKEGDYDDKVLDEMTVKPHFYQVEEFMDVVELHLQNIIN